MSDRRFLVLHLPQLATDRIRQKEPDLAGAPIATWDTQGNRRVLTGVDAPGTTLHVGQALADAQAMHPALVLRPADPAADGASWLCWRVSRMQPRRWCGPDSTAGSFSLARRLPRLPRCRLARCGCRMFVWPVSTGSVCTASVTSCGNPVHR